MLRSVLRTTFDCLGIEKEAISVWRFCLSNYREARSFVKAPASYAKTKSRMAGMIASHTELPALSMPEQALTTPICYLSGKRFWYQTLYCMYSLQTYSSKRLAFSIYDDGTLKKEWADNIVAKLPWTRIVWKDEIMDRISSALPERRYPNLRKRREDFVLLRKITDIRAGQNGWSAVLDSDMLFFRQPLAFLDWLNVPAMPCFLVDQCESYGYSRQLMEELAGAVIPQYVNVGINGYDNDSIDWDRLDSWCKTMLDREGPSYYQEQAFLAMLAAGQKCLHLDSEDYQVYPTAAESTLLKRRMEPRAALHHYVDDSRRTYFQYGWQCVLQQAQQRAYAPLSGEHSSAT